VATKTPGTGSSDGVGKGEKVVGVMGGLMMGSVTVDGGAVVDADAALDVI
jgi:hypothetical protein